MSLCTQSVRRFPLNLIFNVTFLTHTHTLVRWISNLVTIRHRWTATWEPCPENSAFTDMALTERVLVTESEKNVHLAANDSTIRQVGPGIVILKVR
jgi:hypothetical protein